jgi:phytoene synthase
MEDIKNIDTLDVMKKSKTSFLFSTLLLSKEKSEALKTIYAFCRKSDDIVDDVSVSIEKKISNLEKWNTELKKTFESGSDIKLLNDLNVIKEKYNIPEEPFFELLKGMELDLSEKRYDTFEELKQYCYYAASTVGLMTIRIFGFENPKTIDFAINLGIALQLTNILRDIKKDALLGRIYLPIGDMKKFGYNENDLINNLYNENFISLMKYEVERAKQFYIDAKKCLAKEDEKNMSSAILMEKTYYKILKEIEKNEYDVFSEDIHVSVFNKLMVALSVYFKYKLLK